MRIDSKTGVVTLGGIRLSGGMTPAELKHIPGFRKNSELDDESWYWADPRDGYDWTPFFNRNRLSGIQLALLQVDDPTRKNRTDDLLAEMLGSPHERTALGKRVPQSILWLAQAEEMAWRYDWGGVESVIEPRDWTSLIQVAWTEFAPEGD